MLVIAPHKKKPLLATETTALSKVWCNCILMHMNSLDPIIEHGEFFMEGGKVVSWEVSDSKLEAILLQDLINCNQFKFQNLESKITVVFFLPK